MLYWENENPVNGAVHHLMVLCYHIQHPELYSREGLAEGIRLLTDFVDGGLTTEEIRRRNRARVDSANRSWKIKGKPGNQGSFSGPVRWKMTAADVVAGGEQAYIPSVQRWARLTLAAVRETGDLPAQ